MAHDLAHDSDDAPPAETGASEDCGTPLLDRRNYLQLGVLAVGTMAVAGRGRAASTTRHGISFDRVVDAVDDLGWDPNGTHEIDVPTDDGVLIEVPPGEYVFEGTGSKRGLVEGDLSNWGLRGTGDHWSDVVFRTSNGQSTRFMNCGWDSEGVLLENVTFDHTDSRTGGDIGQTIRGRDALEVHDVEHIGTSGKEPHCRWTMQPQITTHDGVANIVNYRKTGPSVFTGHGNSDGGGGVFSGHKGTANFINCRIENQGGDGGLYTGKHTGQVNFYDSYFANNDMAVMRMGAGSEMHGCTLVMDWENAHPDNVVLDGEWGQRAPTGTSGIYSSSAQFGKSGGGIYDTDIIVKDTYRPGQAALAINNSEGNMEVKNCRIQVDVDGMPGIWGRNPADQRLSNHKTPSRPWGLTIENCSITGRSDDPAILLDHRHGSIVRNCCIQMQGSGPGIVLENADDCRIENTNVNTNGRATVFRNCTARTSGITSSDSCPRPDASWDGGDGESGSDSESGGDDTDDGQPTTSTGEEYVLSVDGDGSFSEYEFTVDGGIRDNPNEGPLAGPDQISGSTASGSVGGGTDSFLVAGQIVEFSLDGSAAVLLAGKQVAPGDLPDLTKPVEEPEAPVTSPDDPGTKHVIEFVGTGVRASYEFTVDGDVAPDATRGTVDSQDAVSGSTATGVVLSGTDAYTFTGSITAFSMDGNATVRLDGEDVAPDDLPEETVPENPEEPEEPVVEDPEAPVEEPETPVEDPMAEHVIEFVGTGTRAAYEFTASGSLAHNRERGTVDSQDAVSESTATGVVLSGTDAYTFTGEVTAFSMDGSATVRLDGEAVDPARFESDHTLTVVSDSATASAYRFTVTGDLSADPERGSLEEPDNISGPSAEGAVSNDVDGYQFTGEVADFDLRGDAVVYLDGNQVSPDRLGTDEDPALPNVIVVDGTGSSGRCDYWFTVTGEVHKSFELGSTDADDTIEDGTVTGSVEGEVDAYRFTGDITAFDMDGTAAIHFEESTD